MGRRRTGQRRPIATTVVAAVAVLAVLPVVTAGKARAALDPGPAVTRETPTTPAPLTPPAAGRLPPSPAARTAAIAPVGGRVLRPFDPPATPYGRGHRGVDLATSPGEVVRAALGGTVTFAGQVAGVGWVTVAHGDGLSTTYGRVRPQVRAGDRVTLGQALGRATNAGRIDWGARRDGVYIDPLGLVRGWTVRLVPVE